MIRKMTYIIVDDNRGAIGALQKQLAKMNNMRCLGEFTDPMAALKFLEKEYVDLVLLDVQMEPITGIDFATLMPKETKVIFVSGYSEFALEGCELDACDYVLKPVTLARLKSAVSKAACFLGLSNDKLKTAGGDYYFFMVRDKRSRARRLLIRFDELIYLEAAEHIVRFHLSSSSEALEVVHTLRYIMGQLPASSFVHVHRGFAINLGYFSEVKGKTIKMRGTDTEIPLGRKEYYPAFFEWIESNSI